MAAERQIGIRMTVDATSVTTMVPQATREFERLGVATESAAQRATRSVAQVNMSVRDLVTGAAGLTIVASAIHGITNALTSLPQRGFAFTSEVEVAQMGMSGILGSMTAINGQQTTWNQGLRISADMIGKLNDDALRTAATSQELVGVFQALLAPGLAAKMTLEEVRQLTVVGTNAVKSMGLQSQQVVQELRDLVAGGISPASSTLATALGLKDSDIAAAKASSEGLFAFLMKRLEGFKASSEAFSSTIKGSFDQLQEGATRVAAEAMTPLTQAIRIAVDETSKLFLTIDQAGNAQLNQGLISGLRDYAEAGASALTIGRDTVAMLWEHRDGITTLAAAYAAFKISQWGADAARALAAQMELAQAARLARVEAVAQQATDAQAVLTSREKVAAIMAELQAQQLAAQADAAAAASQIAHLQTTREAIALSRAEVLAKMESARSSMAQAEAQIQAARAAGAQSFALAMVREGTVSLSAAQTRHAALMSELAVLGQQQARVNAAITASTVAQTAATNAASAAAGRLAAAQGAASVASRGFGLVVGALGGPVGIAIIAVSALAMWLYRLKSAADDAAKAGVQIQRAEAAAARGEKPEMRDIAAMQSELDKWKDKRDNLLASGKDSMTEWVNGAPVKSTVESLNAGIANLEGRLVKLNDAAQNGSAGNQQLTLTLEGTRQAWAKANADVKTASALQEDYQQKLQASQSSYKAYREQLEKNNAGPKALADAAARQAENEKALASERDKQLKSLNGSAGAESAAARSEKRGIDAQIEAVRQGYKLMAAHVADGMDAIDSERRQDLVSEYTAVQRKRDLQLQDLRNREAAVKRELELSRQKKDSEKEQQTLQGELREIEQQRANVQAKAGRDLQEQLVAPQIAQRNALVQTTAGIYEQAQAQEAQNTVHGKAKTALHDLTISQLERQRADLEATDNVIPGYIKALDDRIAAEKRLRVAVGESEGLEIAADWKKKQRDDAKKLSDDTRSMFRQGVVDAFEGGDGALASIGKSLRNTILTSIADAFYDAMLKESVDSFTGLLASSLKSVLGGGGSGASLGKSILGSLGTVFSGGLSGNAAAAAANAIGGTDSLGTMIGLMGLVKSAKGNIFSGAAGLHSYVNTLVDRPTIFPFAKGGLGLMGEAGTEGIFPLKRDGQGRLGVIAQGAGGSGGGGVVFSPNNVFNIDARADQGQIMANLQQALGQNNRAQFEQLQTMGVVPK